MKRLIVSVFLFAAVGCPVVAAADAVASGAELTVVRRSLDLASGRYDRVPPAYRWESLTVGDKSYARARIRSFDTWNAVVFYDRGIVSVPLARLPAEVRRSLGYDDARPPAPPVLAPLKRPASAVKSEPIKARPRVVWQYDPVARALISFGERAMMRAEVDLRPDFERMGLAAKNQGQSPSCAVYAVTAALEYHLAMSGRQPARLAESYLYWASLRSIGRTKDRVDQFGGELNYEGGLGLTEVVQSLRSYGIPNGQEMAPAFDPLRDTPPDPVQRAAWANCRVGYIMLNGRTKRDRLEQMVMALNEGLPVVVGMVWPVASHDFARSGDVRDRPAQAGYGHAVLITGYSCPDGVPEHTTFRFRNSYGASWGDQGYGTVPWPYLEQHCYDGLFLDLR